MNNILHIALIQVKYKYVLAVSLNLEEHITGDYHEVLVLKVRAAGFDPECQFQVSQGTDPAFVAVNNS